MLPAHDPANGALVSCLRTSKLLVRPMLETAFAGTAAMKKPGFLVRKAYSEWKDELKMFPHMTAAERAATEKEFEDFKREFLKAQPGYQFDSKEASVWDSAVAAGMEKHYNTAYRIYCKFTHGALGAVTGALNRLTDELDTQIVISCVLYALELLKAHTPATRLYGESCFLSDSIKQMPTARVRKR